MTLRMAGIRVNCAPTPAAPHAPMGVLYDRTVEGLMCLVDCRQRTWRPRSSGRAHCSLFLQGLNGFTAASFFGSWGFFDACHNADLSRHLVARSVVAPMHKHGATRMDLFRYRGETYIDTEALLVSAGHH